jgi:hypothetical protein
VGHALAERESWGEARQQLTKSRVVRRRLQTHTETRARI